MNTKKSIWILLVIVLGLLVGACSTGAGSSGDPLEGTSWELYAIRKSKPIPGSHISASFEDGQISGTSGCNTYFGAYEVDGGRITISTLGMTEMACMEPEGVMEQEIMILEYLSAAQTFQLQEDQLMIFRPDGEALTFIPEG